MRCLSAEVADEDGVAAAPPQSLNSASPGNGFAATTASPKAGAMSAEVVTGGNVL